MTTEQAAHWLRENGGPDKTPKQIYMLCRSGGIKSSKFGKEFVIPMQSLVAYQINWHHGQHRIGNPGAYRCPHCGYKGTQKTFRVKAQKEQPK